MKKFRLFLVFSLLCGCSKLQSNVEAARITDDIPGLTIPQTIRYETYASLSKLKIAWGIGRSLDANKQPIDAVQANQHYGKYNASFIGAPTKQIYLTFDAGYENGYTSDLLDILQEKQVSAVFYITSQYAKENKDLVMRMINEGHAIGNHTWRHKSFGESDLPTVYEEIMRMHELMLTEYGYEMTLVRPPKGEFNEQSLAMIHDMGYHTSLWSVAYYDWDNNAQPSEASALHKLHELLHPGAIVLLHANSRTNRNILGDFIDETRKQGYEFVPYDLYQ